MSRDRQDTLVSLNEAEKEIGSILAKKRYEQARNNNIEQTVPVKTWDVLEYDREGIFAEMAFCKIADVYPQLVFTIAVMSVKMGADYGDVFYKGKNIDVKSTTHEKGKLIANVKNDNVDYYALMVGKEGEYRLAGLMKAQILCQEERYGLHNIFKRACFKADQSELIGWQEFSNIA